MHSDRASEPTLLEVSQLKKYFPVHHGPTRRVVGQVHAVDNVSFHVRKGETLGLVGESGCGKTTLGRTLVRLIEPTGGKVVFRPDGQDIDITAGTRASIEVIRQKTGFIFQDPYSSLNPRMNVGRIVGEPLEIHRRLRGVGLRDQTVALLESVGLKAEHASRYPHQFSGGQRQRIMIARALALKPPLVIADEPVSALDVSVQAQVLNLLQDLRDQLEVAYLLIAHDLGVVAHISDRIAVMYLGQIVELAPSRGLYTRPRHPYTEALISSIPKVGMGRRGRSELVRGEVPSPANPPKGCRFHTRCPHVQQRCVDEPPALRRIAGDAAHLAACHFADTLHLKGAGPLSAAAARIPS